VLDERRGKDDTDVLADELLKVSKAEMAAGPLSLPDRVQQAEARRGAELEYLRGHSPSAAAAVEAARAA
jgi:hypothetical protein